MQDTRGQNVIPKYGNPSQIYGNNNNNSSSIPAMGGGAYKYGGSGIGGPVGSLGGGVGGSAFSVPKYNSGSGIAGGIGSLGSAGG